VQLDAVCFVAGFVSVSVSVRVGGLI